MPNVGPLDLTAADYEKQFATRRLRITVGAAVLTVIFTTALIVLKGNALIPIGVLSVLVLMGLAWQFPKTMFYIMLIGACLIETYPQNFPDSVTDLIPLFWDVNTIFQTYLHMGNFHAIPLSLFETILLLSAFAWLLRGIYFNKLKFNVGTLFLPIMLYVSCVICALLNGLATGGQFNISLFEIRAQFYLLLAYLMAVNVADGEIKHLSSLLWTSAIVIGIKGVLCTFRFIVTLKGVTIPEIGIGAHEESFFFDCFLFELVVLKVADLMPKLRRIMLCFLPFVLIANLANERRAATAAIAIALIVMLALAAVAFAKRRRTVAITAIVIAACAAVYLPLFWNGTGTIAQPARAIKSQFSPDPRDASSNAYRDAENANLIFTLRFNPIFGYGYGKPICEDTPMVDLTQDDPLIMYITHNQILWVWMRTGSVGFYFFWLMISAIIIQGCQLLRNPDASDEAKAGALIAVLIVVMQMIFGLLDMQISNVRNMIYTGLWVGMISILTTATNITTAKRAASVKSTDGDDRSASRWNLPTRETVVL